MSSYLNIYLKIKDNPTPIRVMSFSRSHPLYEFFHDNNLSVYGYGGVSEGDSEVKYAPLNIGEFKACLIDFKREVTKDEHMLETLKQFPGVKGYTIEYVTSQLEYIDERKEAVKEIEAIEFFIDNYEFTDVEGFVTNYD